MSKNDYISQLHRIICNSADVLPDKVTNYLETVVNSGSYKVKKQIITELNTYKLLINYVPECFVDSILDFLIKKPINHQNQGFNDHVSLTPEEIERAKKYEIPLYLFSQQISSPDDSSQGKNLSIEDYYAFSPPTYIQGPFFYLLSKNEDQGLRLIGTLTNSAVIKWQENCHHNYHLTPLPIMINLSSGSHNFRGDMEVYCWFRGTSDCPHSVVSALMALEEWMERQIEAGRDIEALFEKVLNTSNCVAILGICLSMALAYPEKCLKVALPIAICPGIWEMDIERWHRDSNSSIYLFRGFDPNNDWLYTILERQNKKTQRSQNICSLAMRYMWRNDSLRTTFEQAMEKFTDNLPFRYEEEKLDTNSVASLQEKMEEYKVFGRRENYQCQQVGEQLQLWVKYPEEMRKQNEGLQQKLMLLSQWAEQTIKDGTPQERMTLEEAIATAKELQTSEDFTQTDSEDIPNTIRLQGIAGVAAATLIADFEWATTQNHLEWCRAVLLAAARSTEASIDFIPSYSVKSYAGQGLALLATYDVADMEVRRQILQLIGESLKQYPLPDGKVGKALFYGLQNAWNIDRILCWNALSLCISLSIVPRELRNGTYIGRYGTNFDELKAWEEKVTQDHLEYLEKDELPELPTIPMERNFVFVYTRVQYGLCTLPLTKLCQDTSIKDKLLQLCNDLVARMIIDNLPVENERYKPYDSNTCIFDWAADLAKSLSSEEIHQHILIPVRNNWSQVPQLTADLLNGYINYQITFIEEPTTQALEIWKEICNWVLDSPEIAKKTSEKHLDLETGEILQLIIFAQNGSSHIRNDWQHAHLFIDVFDKWVSVAGHNPYAYGHFLTMLNGIGWQFAPKITLKWLDQCANNTIYDLWNQRENGIRTAKLLNRIWHSFEKQIRNNKELLKRYSSLVDQLVKAGIPLAGTLQQKLEGRK